MLFKLCDYVDRIYSIEFEIKDTTDRSWSSSYLDSERRLRAKLYDKDDDFNFLIVNFPFISSNFPTAPAYGI